MPSKFKRCVKKVSKQKGYNPYAVCRVSTGYYGSTRHKKLKSSMMKDKKSKDDVYGYCQDCGGKRKLYKIQSLKNKNYKLICEQCMNEHMGEQ